MFIIDVIPISRGIQKQTLSYFTASSTPPGSVVSVPLRSKKVLAIVVSSLPARDLKYHIRRSIFGIKKVDQLVGGSFLLPVFMEAAEKIADYFATSLGSVLSVLVPKAAFENAQKLKNKKSSAKIPHAAEHFVLQADDTERYAHYKSLIREEFAKKFSVFFCLPSIQEIEEARLEFEKGIEPYTFVFHSGLKQKELIPTWKKALACRHPILIIATAGFLSLPRSDIGTIIVDRENSRGFYLQSRPHLDLRVSAEIFAATIGARFVVGDLVARVETLWKEKEGDYIALAPLKFRALSSSRDYLIDMRTPKSFAKGEFRVLSDELLEAVSASEKQNQHVFIFASRKGLFPTTVCSDCGRLVTCLRCSSPVVLHKDSENYFLCHRCGDRRSAREKCLHCGSWRLTPLGIGIERIIDDIKKKFPKISIVRFDSDVIKNKKTAGETAANFYKNPQALMVGTEMAIPYLREKIDTVAIASIDSLFSIPDFRIRERVLRVLLTLRSLAGKLFLIQTRNVEEPVIDFALKGNLIDFFRDEIAERKQFGYPPFSVFIKFTVAGSKRAVLKEINKLEKILETFKPLSYPAFSPFGKARYAQNLLIKLPSEDWPDKNLLEIIRSLPPQITVKVEPENLL